MVQTMWWKLLCVFLFCVGGNAQDTDSPTTLAPTLSPSVSVAPSPALPPPPPEKDVAGQVMGALIFIALIVLLIGFGIYGWRKKQFSELTRIDLEQGQTLDDMELTDPKLNPDDVALAAAVGPTYFEKSQGEEEKKENDRKREDSIEQPAVIHTSPEVERRNSISTHERRASLGGHERRSSFGGLVGRRASASEDPFSQLESALSQPLAATSDEADRQAKHLHDLAMYEAHQKKLQEEQAERRASVGAEEPVVPERRASLDQMIMNEVEAKRRADAAAAAAKQAEEALEKAEEDMRLRQQEELREAERRAAEAAEARKALLLLEQAREAEAREAETREAEKAQKEADERAESERREAEKAQQEADERAEAERREAEKAQQEADEREEAEKREAEKAQSEAEELAEFERRALEEQAEEAEKARQEADERSDFQRRALEELAQREREAAAERSLDAQESELRPTLVSSDPFAELDTETEPRSPPLVVPSSSTPRESEVLSPGEDDDGEAALAAAQAALEAAEAEQRAMEAALEAERLAEEADQDDVTDLS